MSNVENAEMAFRRLYDAHYGAVLAYCQRRTTDFDAHDAVSEVFTVVWKKIDQRPDEHKVLPWLYGISFRVMGHQWRGRDRYRKLERQLAGHAQQVEIGPEATVVQQAENHRVTDAMHRLRSTDQEILRLAGWEELTHSEIASTLGISVAAVDQRVHRAKKRLAREYEKLTSTVDTSPSRKGGAG